MTPEQFTQLRSDDGQAILTRLRDLAPTPTTELRIAIDLRKIYPSELVAIAMTQHQLRQRARTKFANADEMWFTRDGLEQATSERIANVRAAQFAGCQRIADLCCGIGGDLLALASLSSKPEIMAVDLDPVHLAMAEANAETLGVRDRITFCQADVRNVDLTGFDGVFIDPARRNDKGRLGRGDGEPPLDWCFELNDRVPNVGIKTAPGIDHDLIPDGWGLQCIALGFDLKEAVLWSPAIAKRQTRLATVITDAGAIHLAEECTLNPELIVPEVGLWLLDPNPAVTRAGLVETLATKLDARKIDEQIGFLVASEQVETPFARAYPILASLPWNEKQVKRTVQALDGGPVDIRRRGLAGDVDLISKRLRGIGKRPLFIAMTRVGNKPWAIICDQPTRSLIWGRPSS